MAHSAPGSGTLAREAIGLREVFFQAVTHMAPAAAVAFSIIIGANFAGGALPLSVVFPLIGCLLYYLRERRSEFSPLEHGLVPILGIFAFVPGFLVAIGVGGSVFDFIAPLPYPYNVVGPVVGIWYLIGVVYLVYLYSREPQGVRDTARVFVEDEVAEASAPI